MIYDLRMTIDDLIKQTSRMHPPAEPGAIYKRPMWAFKGNPEEISNVEY
jgi:hypothetical protein